MPLISFLPYRAVIVDLFDTDLYDPHWSKVIFLSHMDGANDSQTFVEEKGKTISVNQGTPFLTTTQKKFGVTAVSLNGTSALNTLTYADHSLPGAFTVEYFVRLVVDTGSNSMFSLGPYSNGILIRNSGGDSVYVNGIQVASKQNILQNGQWHHVALTRDASNVVRYFIDGVQVNTNTTVTGTVNSTADMIVLGRSYHGATERMNGQLDEIRVTNGVARYVSTFEVPTKAFPSQSNPLFEPIWGSTELLLTGEGLNNGTNNTFVDSSLNAFAVTRGGNITQGLYSPHTLPDGYWSNVFDGSNDYFTIAQNEAFNFGTGDLTFECWMTWDGTYEAGGRVLFGTGGPGGLDQLGIFEDGSYGLYCCGIATQYWPPVNVWTHIAVTRASGTVRIFINGVLIQTSSQNAAIGNSSAPMYVGRRSDNHSWKGHISNLRLVKGTALYVSEFTPSMEPLTAIAGTSLLLCQSARFKDNSSNNFAFTVYGNIAVSTDTPLNNPSDLSLTVGSAYCDGAGDYAVLPAGAVNSSGDFTIEGWFNSASMSAVNTLFSNCAAGLDVNYFHLYTVSGVGNLRLQVRDASGQYLVDGSRVLPLNNWFHVAMTRQGSTFKVYLNGVLEVTGSTTKVITSRTLHVGAFLYDSFNTFFTGHISNFRVSNTVKYTDAFVPGLVALESDTTALLNFANGQIIDYTGKQVLETVGNVKCVTSGFASGAGSMYFDGSGDYAKVANNSFGNFGLRNFTVEAWVKPTTSTGLRDIISRRTAVLAGGFFLGLDALTPKMYVSVSGAGTWDISNIGTRTIPLNIWSHVAIVRYGNTFSLYVNGVLSGSATNSGAILTSTIPMTIGAASDGTGGITGFIDDARVTVGFARYVRAFAPQMSAPRTKYIIDASNTYDPYWNNVELMMHMEGNNLSTTFVDDATGSTISGGASTLSTDVSKFGASSFKVNTGGTLINNAALMAFGTGDFTIETWVRPTSAPTGNGQSILAATTTNGVLFGYTNQSASWGLAPSGSSWVIMTTTMPELNVWSHLAVTRKGGTLRLFLNGVVVATVKNNTTNFVASTTYLGGSASISAFPGYLEEVRVTKGVARYLKDFMPDTAAFPSR